VSLSKAINEIPLLSGGYTGSKLNRWQQWRSEGSLRPLSIKTTEF